MIPFDADFARRSAEEFVEEVLVEALGATHVSVGENFRFGNRAKGDPQMLAEDDRFSTRVVPLFEVDGEIVSSSHIRGLVLAGEVEQATHFLGAPFQMRGEVVHGDERGRELGFPTANLVPDDALVCPGHGVYACLANGDTRRGERWGASHFRHWPRRAGRGLSFGLRGRPVWSRVALGFLVALAGRAAFPISRGLGRADASRRRAHTRSPRRVLAPLRRC